MNSTINLNNNNKKLRKFTNLKADLKNLVFSFLQIEECFNSIYLCNKLFLITLKKTKIFNLITGNKELKDIKKLEDSYDELLMKIHNKWQAISNTLEKIP